MGISDPAEFGDGTGLNGIVDGAGWIVAIVVDDEFDGVPVDAPFWPNPGPGLDLTVCGAVVVFECVSSEGVYKM